jgi:hypothetical protein
MKKLALLGFALLGLAFAADTTLKLTINGKVSNTPAIVVAGKTYLPLDALERAGLKVVRSNGALAVTLPGSVAPAGMTPAGTTKPAPAQASGGSNEKASLAGCIGEQLFNGVWRIKVTKLERISKDQGEPFGWALSLELRNGSKVTTSPAETGVESFGGDIQLAFADAGTIVLEPRDAQKLTYAKVPVGAAVVMTLPYFYPFGTKEEDIKTPVKFLFQIDPSKMDKNVRASGVAYSVANPSFRIKLDCQK